LDIEPLRSDAAADLDALDFAIAGCGIRRDAPTADALRRAGLLLSAERVRDALAMLDYARRLAPSDSGIRLALGLVQLNHGAASAIESLKSLTHQSDWRDLWMVLIRARMRFGEVDRAAIELHTTLGRNAPPVKPPDIALAHQVSERSGAAGWCGLNNAGCLILGATGPGSDLEILLDGVAMPFSHPRAALGPSTLRLPPQWARAQRLDVLSRGRNLIGSPVDVTRITRVEGFVEAIPEPGALRGWCWLPAERERAPSVTVASLPNPDRRIECDARLVDPSLCRGDAFGFPYGFAIDAEAVAHLGDAISVTGPHGQALYGSPLLPESDLPIVPKALPSRRRRAGLRRNSSPPVDIIIPVYAGLEVTLACISSVQRQMDPGNRIIAVADASPDQRLIAELSALADQGLIVLRVETVRRGFPGTANIGLGLCLAAGHDAVLLNADAEVTPGWLAGLRTAVYGAGDIGTATPLSNDATIFSYPRQDACNPCPDAAAAAALAALALQVNVGVVVDVPTGHGFCLYIRAACLAETGLLRTEVFAQGYGEENDFCLRARAAGWRHVAVPSVFVAHHGGVSFGAARDDLRQRNLHVLNRLHPGYDRMVASWQGRDPLADSRRRLDLARLRQDCGGREALLLVTHNRAGGIRHHVRQRTDAIARSGRQPLVLRPDPARAAGTPYAVVLDTGTGDAYPNLRFRLPDESDAFAACLKACGVTAIEVNSMIGHTDSLVDLLLALDIPFDVVIHDYSWFCPRITLTTGGHRYCGEPAITGCRACVASYGSNFDDAVSPDHLVARSQRLMRFARAVIAPSDDTARRIRNHFATPVLVRRWQQPRRLNLRRPSAAAGHQRAMRVCVVGAIGYEKGYNTLLSCARLAASANLKLTFVVVGYTCDDARLLDTGVVRITGPYDDTEAITLIGAQDADFAWLPAVWPETWSYVLTQVWEAGLFVVVHDIGAPAERVRAADGGFVAPLHVSAERLIELFLDPALFRAAGARRAAPCRAAPS
jgi:GT2 family glycosyltransferase/glycosyltransferase involved in cell wall biosynthesis